MGFPFLHASANFLGGDKLSVLMGAFHMLAARLAIQDCSCATPSLAFMNAHSILSLITPTTGTACSPTSYFALAQSLGMATQSRLSMC
jgi:hypothetical protein